MVIEDRKRVALIPAYEPDETLKILVTELLENHFEVVVVDDGSGENYEDYFNLDATVISYKENKGKGYALKKGLNDIRKKYDKYIVVTMDSDGQHTVKDAIKICDALNKNPETLVLGIRKRGENTPLRSYLGNSITKMVYHLVTGIEIYDTQTGLRAFTEKLVPYMMRVEGERYEYEMNVLLELKKEEIKIKEIPIETIYINNNENSHFNTLKDSWRIYKEIIKFSASSILSFLIDYTLYFLCFITSKNIIFSNIISRIISSIANYNMNKNLVFQAKGKKHYLFKYYVLVVNILLLNTLILMFLSKIINPFLAKIITEVILFILSFLVQKKIIFKKEGAS